MPQPSSFDSIAHDLSLHEYSVSEGLLSGTHITALAGLSLAHQQAGRLVRARTGQARTTDDALRGDSISWLDANSLEAPVIDCLATFDALRLALNEQLFMNLHELESHFAIYPPGAVYEQHLDRFATGPQHRQLSLVLYLNDGWISANGGSLRIHLGNPSDGPSVGRNSANNHIDISPTSGRLVLFVSARFWHEVLPSTRDRLSVTGWFRTRSLL